MNIFLIGASGRTGQEINQTKRLKREHYVKASESKSI